MANIFKKRYQETDFIYRTLYIPNLTKGYIKGKERDGKYNAYTTQ